MSAWQYQDHNLLYQKANLPSLPSPHTPITRTNSHGNKCTSLSEGRGYRSAGQSSSPRCCASKQLHSLPERLPTLRGTHWETWPVWENWRLNSALLGVRALRSRWGLGRAPCCRMYIPSPPAWDQPLGGRVATCCLQNGNCLNEKPDLGAEGVL